MKKFTNIIWGVLAVLLTILVADAVASDGVLVNELPSLLEGFIRETLFPLASALVLALVGILVKRLSEKTKVQTITALLRGRNSCPHLASRTHGRQRNNISGSCRGLLQ